MKTLIYSDVEIGEYVSYWNDMSSDISITLSALNVLSDSIYKMAIGALISGLISFNDIKSMISINDRFIELLIFNKLKDNVEFPIEERINAIAWAYRTDYLKNNTKFDKFRADSIGDKNVYARRITYDIFSHIYVPKYDISGVDESKYRSFDEVRAAYEAAGRQASIKEILNRFDGVRKFTSIQFPISVPKNGTDCVNDAVYSCVLNPWFIYSKEGPTGDIWDVCEMLIRQIFENIPPHIFNILLANTVTPAMAYKIDNDVLLTGRAGMDYLRIKTDWDSGFKYIDGYFSTYLSELYLAKYYLPLLYDELYPNDKFLYDVLLNYLRAARTAIIEIATNIIKMISDPVEVRKTLLSPLGLLFLVSGVTFNNRV